MQSQWELRHSAVYRAKRMLRQITFLLFGLSVYCKKSCLWQILALREWHLPLKFYLIRKILLTQRRGCWHYLRKEPRTETAARTVILYPPWAFHWFHTRLVYVWVMIRFWKGSSDPLNFVPLHLALCHSNCRL